MRYNLIMTDKHFFEDRVLIFIIRYATQLLKNNNM